MSDSAPGPAAPHDVPTPYIERTRSYYQALGYGAPYEWAHCVEVPFQPLTQPLAVARVALVTTAAPHKPEAGGYAEHKYVSSFVGFGPVAEPRFIVAVMIDEPAGAKYYGGDVGAPVFSSVMGAALRLMAVPPDASQTLAAAGRGAG